MQRHFGPGVQRREVGPSIKANNSRQRLLAIHIDVHVAAVFQVDFMARRMDTRFGDQAAAAFAAWANTIAADRLRQGTATASAAAATSC